MTGEGRRVVFLISQMKVILIALLTMQVLAAMWEREASHEVFIHSKKKLALFSQSQGSYCEAERARPSRKLLDLQQTASVFKVRPVSLPSPAALGKTLEASALGSTQSDVGLIEEKSSLSGGEFSTPLHKRHLFTLLLCIYCTAIQRSQSNKAEPLFQFHACSLTLGMWKVILEERMTYG